ncbi:PucR family transcriptional regulator [Nonomuraea sp. K274]|uniref:PucR family transcriptional regulator n=1 Tax=Nonomuraea cypriaca TaxID=1187855 RepID=A0A931AD62_9ACTN|nr:PucR family transcriptional regulator [Nonomuraea cypriaca]MBF8190601.1 PucR family transcriptional regulator [Nonomuraea cypriaca]
MAVTIRQLVADARLGLRVVLGHEGLDHPVRWVAVSELPDPAPWLDGAELLLTSGMWLRDEPDRTGAAQTWAARLAAADARAVGFGLDPWFTEIPAEVIRATRRHRLTLLEVPVRTPFVAVDRAVADLNAAEARSEAEQARRVQQRLAEAGRAGRQAVTDRLARELRGWVAVLDGGHAVTLRAPHGEGPSGAALSTLARRADHRSLHMLQDELDGVPVTAVPLGPARERRGTLCVGAAMVAERPNWTAGVVGTAAALLTVLERGGDRELRGVVGGLLAEGDPRSAARVAAVIDLPLPAEMVAVALAGPGHRQATARIVAAGGWPASRDPAVVLATPGFGAERLPGLLGSARAGVSMPRPPADATAGIRQALLAVGLTTADRPVVHYADTPAMELDRLLASPAAARFSDALLTPVTAAPDADALLAAARAWVAANYRWDPAAAAAGVHRETIRARLHRLAALASLDLDTPGDRLALSLALTVLPSPSPSPGTSRPPTLPAG